MKRTERELFSDVDFRRARSRVIFLWTHAKDSENYDKEKWIDLMERLNDDESPDEIIAEAEALYELNHGAEWPSHLAT